MPPNLGPRHRLRSNRRGRGENGARSAREREKEKGEGGLCLGERVAEGFARESAGRLSTDTGGVLEERRLTAD